jgi:CRP/FNR family transcriptional regulator, cyclic AMP receptor protein
MGHMNLTVGSGAEERVLTAGYSQPCRLGGAVAMARSSAWLAGLPDAFVEQFLASASLRQYRRGQVIIEFDQRDHGLHFLLDGAVDVWVPRLTGELLPVHLIPPYHWFGEFGALTGQRGFAEYCTKMPSTSLYIPRAAIVALEMHGPAYREVLMELLSLSIRHLLELSGDLAGLDPEKRVMSKLVTLTGCASPNCNDGEHVLPISQIELGVVCCVSRATMNLILAKLEKAGLVRLGYRRVVVLRRQELLTALKEER